MEDPVTAVTKHLVIKRLAGNSLMIMVAKEYFVDGVSPSTISYKYRVSKFRVRGYIQRVTEKIRNPYLASSIVKQVFPLILEVEPAVIKVGDRFICLLCDQSFNNEVTAENHIRRKHVDYVDETVKEIINDFRSAPSANTSK
ncbi:MAG: C2H2-type zinc finger protein [Zestosphaera sp.]